MREHNIFYNLFHFNCDLFLQSVFLLLDPASIKKCRSVCKQWDGFIKRRLWTSRVGRRRLKSKLSNLWKNGESEISPFAWSKRVIYCIECDDNAVYCGTVDGFTEIYNVVTGELMHQLCCKDHTEGVTECVQFSIGEDIIATLTECGNICLWDKQTCHLEYQARPHEDGVGVYGIKARDNKVVTGASDGNIFVFEKEEGEQWVKTLKVNIKNEEVIHIEIDLCWLVTGTDSSIHLWNLASLADGPKSDAIDIAPWMFLFHFPFIFVVGGENWSGFQVWNVETNKRIRNFQLENKLFHTLSSNCNWDFIVFCEIVMLWPGDAPVNIDVLIFDTKELCDATIINENLWRRKRSHLQSFDHGEVNACINQTSLLVAHGHMVDIQNFWLNNFSEDRPKRRKRKLRIVNEARL